uniref:Putative thyroid transcription factor 1-associated protein 26 n=1 Tax=Nyssomyia neivai TaxID=330878 RepID=A0A1L8DFU0_9DIPT
MKTKNQNKPNFPGKSHNKLQKGGGVTKKSPPEHPGSVKKSRKQTQVNYVVNPRKFKFLTNKRSAEEKREQIIAAKEQRQKEVDHKRKQKSLRNKELSKKTKRGQPIMKNQIEFLLNKIQKNLANE